jgi:hypothetical protein
LISVAVIEMKLVMIVYDNVLQINFNSCCHRSIFYKVTALGLVMFMEIYVFRTFCLIPFADIEMKLSMIVYNNKLCRSGMSFITID